MGKHEFYVDNKIKKPDIKKLQIMTNRRNRLLHLRTYIIKSRIKSQLYHNVLERATKI